MRIVSFSRNGERKYGVVENGLVYEIDGDLESCYFNNYRRSGNEFRLDHLSLLPPCEPTKIVCLGLNYRGHAEEMKLPLPSAPIIFMKPATAVIGPGETIIYPPQSSRVDYEAELGVVMGRRAHRVKQAEALDYVLGYTCANDVTARDLQSKNGQWTYAKGFDTFAPLGPWIETGLQNPENLEVKGYLNEKLVQFSSTADHIFPVQELIAYISACMTLLPGDVIITGTPPGIGPLAPGDTFEVEISGIGKLQNRVIKT